MDYQNVFTRQEMKYLITKKQRDIILNVMKAHMKIDEYGKTTIRNLYFDTENYRLIRHSIEKPPYKEKLRIRSYKQVGPKDIVYVELKKKYEKIVYKRRVAVTNEEAMAWLCDDKDLGLNMHIEEEINYFKSYYKTLKPEVYLSYDREAYYSIDGSDLKVTFDENILWRQDGLSLTEETGGTPIIEEDYIIMEIKTLTAIPLWLTSILTKENIYKTSFSKYGKAYEHIFYEYF